MTFPKTWVDGEVWNGAAVTDLESRTAAAAALLTSPNAFSAKQTVTVTGTGAAVEQITPNLKFRFSEELAGAGTGLFIDKLVGGGHPDPGYFIGINWLINGTQEWAGTGVDYDNSDFVFLYRAAGSDAKPTGDLLRANRDGQMIFGPDGVGSPQARAPATPTPSFEIAKASADWMALRLSISGVPSQDPSGGIDAHMYGLGTGFRIWNTKTGMRRAVLTLGLDAKAWDFRTDIEGNDTQDLGIHDGSNNKTYWKMAAGGKIIMDVNEVSGVTPWELLHLRGNLFICGAANAGGTSGTIFFGPQTSRQHAIRVVPTSSDLAFDRWTGSVWEQPLIIANGSKLLTLGDAYNLAVGTTTGSQIATVGGASGQKLGFFGQTPIVQPLLATGGGKLVDDVITVLQNLGLVRQT